MQFLYSPRAGENLLLVQNEQFLHLKARRSKQGDRLDVRNLQDGKKYLYEIKQIDRKNATLELVFASLNERQRYYFEIAWAVVEPKIIEKTLPFLNELGVKKLIFVYTDFSQANFKFDLQRFVRICAASCEQCGRDSLMEFEIHQNIDDFINKYKNVALINFNGSSLSEYKDELLFIGPEGGFSNDEIVKINRSFSLKSQNILRSQTAIIAVASHFLA